MTLEEFNALVQETGWKYPKLAIEELRDAFVPNVPQEIGKQAARACFKNSERNQRPWPGVWIKTAADMMRQPQNWVNMDGPPCSRESIHALNLLFQDLGNAPDDWRPGRGKGPAYYERAAQAYMAYRVRLMKCPDATEKELAEALRMAENYSEKARALKTAPTAQEPATIAVVMADAKSVDDDDIPF